MSTLKVNKLRDTAGSADAITLDPNGGAVLAGVTTMTTARVTSGIVTNTFIVGAGVTISESGIEASGIGITCANINGTQIGGRRNIIINGAMMVAQRGTSTTDEGYLVDRIELEQTNLNEAPTQAQVDVSSSTTPYSEGFRKAFKITNGNQTSADANDRFQVFLKQEAQNIANSGWNYTSSTSYITLQFWVKSSVAQNFYGYLRTKDGTGQIYRFETGSLTADTWTKVVKTIPGNSNLQFDNDANEGLQITFALYYGADFTDSGASLNAWGAYASGTRTPDMTGTLDDWYLTNDATWELTGVQLEVGPQATSFEHRTVAEELQLCKRYYYDITTDNSAYSKLIIHQNGYFQHPQIKHPVEMRAAPSITFSNVARRALNGSGDTSESISNTTSGKTNWTSYVTNTSNTFMTFIYDYPIKFEAEL